MRSSSPYYKSRLFVQVSKRAGKAMMDYQMLQDGDKVAVAVSGGKDSLALLHILRFRRTFIPVRVELMAVSVDPGLPGFPAERLAQYFQEIGIPYHIEKISVLEGGPEDRLSCFWCSWSRRKSIFQMAERYGCNKVALGHHMDDIAATILLNLFYHGEISAMRPRQELFDGKLTLIRPLAYEREQTIVNLTRKEGWPLFDSVPCPLNDTSQRAFVKQLLAQAQRQNPDAVINLFRSFRNVKPEYLLDSREA